MSRWTRAAQAAWSEFRKAGTRTAVATATDLAGIATTTAPNSGLTGFDYNVRTPPDVERALADQGMQTGGPFSPGRPVQQFWPRDLPARQFDFPTGYNVGARPRANERGRISFETLTNLLNSWDVARMCIAHIQRDIRSFDFRIVPKEGVEDDVSDQIKAARKFWSKPNGHTPFDSWQHEMLEDMLRFDAPTIYRNRTRAGKLAGLDIVSGTTIAPLIDFYGRRPRTPAPAFVQFVQGVPALWLPDDALVYEPFYPLPESPYGLPPLEWMLLTANTDLRFQWHFLLYFTEGSVPETFMEAPPDMSDPENVVKFQEAWDATMEGDQAQKHKVRWVPAGSRPQFAPSKNFDENFPMYLMRKTCAAYGVTPHDLGFVSDVNRATGDTQVDVQFRIGTKPILKWAAGLYTRITNEDLGLPDVDFEYDVGGEKEDRYQEAQAMDLYVKMGALSPDEVRQDILGKDVDPEHPVPRFIFSTRAGAIPLKSIEEIAGTIDAATAAPEAGSVTPADDVPPGQYAAPTGVLKQPDDLRSQREASAAPTAPVAGQQHEQAATGLGGGGAVQKATGPSVAGLAVKAADTGRVLMIQRALDPNDPAAGTWEWPGGHVEDGEDALAAAIREWQEELGRELPAGDVAAMWTSPNGIYRGYVYVVPAEADVPINGSADDREVLNPDDPDSDNIEVAAWWDPRHVPSMPALRPECWTTDWLAVQSATSGGAEVAKELARWRDNARKRIRGGRSPRQFASDILPPRTLAAVWARLEKARTPEEVELAFRPFVRPPSPRG